VIAVSEPVAAALRRRGMPASRITLVPNAVDLERLDRPVAPGEADAARRLATACVVAGPGDAFAGARAVIGVVARRKEQPRLLDALAHVAAPVAVVCLGVAADAALAAAAARAATGGGHATACIPFQDDPRPFYELFDLCVLPTREEGMSQALLEAMALGRAVVATAAGGNTALVRHEGDGLLAAPGDDRALGAAVARLVADPALRARLGAEARARVREEFTVERTRAATEAVYAAALARRAAGRS
jgi:glycosyltransferase involved in cell wall biosynthesis